MAKPGPHVFNWQVIDADGSGTMDVTELVQASDSGTKCESIRLFLLSACCMHLTWILILQTFNIGTGSEVYRGFVYIITYTYLQDYITCTSYMYKE